jgi:hypothetical protein
MIDKFLYKFFGMVDNWFNWVDSHFVKPKKVRKKKKPTQEDLFNGE